MNIYELSQDEITRLMFLASCALDGTLRIAVTENHGLMVKVNNDMWSAPMGTVPEVLRKRALQEGSPTIP